MINHPSVPDYHLGRLHPLMTRSTTIENRTQKKQLVFIEPEAMDYWLKPRDSLELRADVVTFDANFEFCITDEGLTVFPSRNMSSISVHMAGIELKCGHQRPDS